MTYMRSVFMCCVPLFLVLSGYLMTQKKPEIRYYKKLNKTLFTYVGASIACVYLYPFLYVTLGPLFGLVKQRFPTVTFLGLIKGILGFTSAPYSWYVEMYIGLFIMIPFLNILYKGISTRKLKLCWIVSCIILTALPAVINVYNFSEVGWWSNPTMLDKAGNPYAYHKLIPSWWVGIYPLTYYYIGCYLKEYTIKIKKSVCILLVFLAVFISGTYCIWRSYGTTFKAETWCSWESLFNVILTVLVFILFLNLDYNRTPYRLKWFFAKLSELCLGIYLVSWIFDSLFYPILTDKVPIFANRLPYYIMIVPLIFICSAIVSYVISKMYQLCTWLLGQVPRKEKRSE